MIVAADGQDPRANLTADDFAIAQDTGPLVGATTRSVSPLLIVSVFVLLAIALFLMLNARRTDRTEAQSLVTPISATTSIPSAYEPPPLDTSPSPAPVVAAQPTLPPAPPPVFLAPTPAATPASLLAPVDANQRRRAPAVVVDLQSATTQASPAAASRASEAGAGVSQGTVAATGASESARGSSPLLAGAGAGAQIAALIGEGGQAVSVASQMNNLSAMVSQGAMIPGVLETAINSDLPGYTRAQVSRDVRSFDGRAVLIPRGSRLIGQYRSAVSMGQSRVFVIWTRVIRPDGVSVDLGSPGADALGRGGLQGEVNRHFFTRFGGSILLSVLNAAVSSLGRTPSTQITIGSPAAAAGAAASADVSGDRVAPTITIKQGEAINIFVARDLDFSNVQPVK